MKKSIPFKRTSIVLAIIVSLVFVLVRCGDIGNEPAPNEPPAQPAIANLHQPPAFGQFAGSAKCSGCHQDIYQKHLKTGHYQSAQPATQQNILGSFAKGKNTYTYSPTLYLEMLKRDSGLFQVVNLQGKEERAMKFDITVGSGATGQSYMSWKGNHLFQLPISYFTVGNQWSNSPGFPVGKVLLERTITIRCLECHTTYASEISHQENEPPEFDRGKMIFGVDCEKCHGPAAQHVAFQTDNPQGKTAKFIINPASFNRQQKLDMCALCHGGRLQKTQPSFSFAAGDALKDYFNTAAANSQPPDPAMADVHGNQYGLLQASQCFIKSNSLTCHSCHSPHEKERGNLALFSQRCMGCHSEANGNFCKINPAHAPSMKVNCIDCHMPNQQSKAIVLYSNNSTDPKAALLRTHFISIYRDEAKKFMKGN
jgi:mono/diheme cytochrome c family protein